MSSVVTERHDKKAQAGVLRLSADGAIRVSATRDDENGDDEDEDDDDDDDEKDDATRANERYTADRVQGRVAEWRPAKHPYPRATLRRRVIAEHGVLVHLQSHQEKKRELKEA